MARIFVCGHNETLADGKIENKERWSDEIDAAVCDTCRMIDDAGHESRVNSHFAEWHGGKFDRGTYRTGFVCALCEDPGQEAIDLIDDAAQFLSNRLQEIGQMEDEENKQFSEN